MMSGSPIKGFREGWALRAFTWGKAHYFRREEASIAVALCGSQDAPAGLLLEEGSFERCKRCARLRKKEVAKSTASASGEAQDARGGVGE